MGRGQNWQRRVETADERRQQIKQQQQQRRRKVTHKSWTHELLQNLDRAQERASPPTKQVLTLHVWTSDFPKVEQQELPIGTIVSATASPRRRMRSGSESSSTISKIPAQRDRSNSMTETYSSPGIKKKVHPRSKQQQDNSGDFTAEPPTLLLCRSHFFTGVCPATPRNKSKASSDFCRYSHLLPPNKSLAKAMSTGAKRLSEKKYRELKMTQEAFASSVSNLDAPPGAMEFLFHVTIKLEMGAVVLAEGEDSSEQKVCSISDQVLQALSNLEIKQSSILYVVLNGQLLFDCHRHGVLLSIEQTTVTILNKSSEVANTCLTSLDVTDDTDIDEGQSSYERNHHPRSALAPNQRKAFSHGHEADESVADIIVHHLPAIILEHILTFLPDSAVASASQVCRVWYNEIGKNSPNLWTHLLQRRDWPVPSQLWDSVLSEYHEDDNDDELHNLQYNHQQMCREAFCQHYLAIRDVTAIKMSLASLTGNSKRSTAEDREMIYQDFSTKKYSPSAPNSCLAVEVWSLNRILVAYSKDCSLRLFEAVQKSGQEKSCREIVCQRVDPYKNTKRRKCTMMSMALDEEAIGCLCHVMADNVAAKADVLIVLSRDDFLLGESSAAFGENHGSKTNDVALNVIDVGEAVLNYLLSFEVIDHRILELIDFLSDGGEIGDVEVLASETIVACGYGRFMVEVTISIPDDIQRVIDRKLVLFSASAGAIVWMGDSNGFIGQRHEGMTLASFRPSLRGGSRGACKVAVTASSSPAIQIATIEPTGLVQSVQLLEASRVVHDEMNDGWTMMELHCRPLIMTDSDVVVVDVLCRRVEDRVIESKTMVSFYPTVLNTDEPSYSILSLDGNIEGVQLVNVRDTHIVLLCRKYTNRAVTGDQSINASLDAIIIHISSRKEIGRIVLIENELSAASFVSFAAWNNCTVGAALSWRGVMMTGSNIRSLGTSNNIILKTTHSHMTTKKKKKRLITKGGKKDVFFRGMTMRG